MLQLNAELICVRCSQNENENSTLEDILLKPFDTLTPDMYGDEGKPEEKEYEKCKCPKCGYELWVALNFRRSRISQDSTR